MHPLHLCRPIKPSSPSELRRPRCRCHSTHILSSLTRRGPMLTNRLGSRCTLTTQVSILSIRMGSTCSRSTFSLPIMPTARIFRSTSIIRSIGRCHFTSTNHPINSVPSSTFHKPWPKFNSSRSLTVIVNSSEDHDQRLLVNSSFRVENFIFMNSKCTRACVSSTIKFWYPSLYPSLFRIHTDH